MKKDKKMILAPTATQEQIEQANAMVNAMVEVGLVITEEEVNEEKLVEVTLTGGVKVICELDENNKVKNNWGIKL